jgi:hypothetical protein
VATVGIQVSAPPRPTGKHPRVTISGYNGKVTIPLDITNAEVDVDNLAAEWAEVARPARLNYLEHMGPRLRRIGPLEGLLDETISAAPGSVETTLLVLAGFADTNGPVTIAFGGLESSKFLSRTSRWVITDYRITTLRRAHGTNKVTRARVTFEFTEHSPSRPEKQIGPPPPSTPAAQEATFQGLTAAQWQVLREAGFGASSSPPRAGSSARRHTVTRGETLWSIATRYYNDGNLWRRIADANGIRDPRKLAIGRVLTIP